MREFTGDENLFPCIHVDKNHRFLSKRIGPLVHRYRSIKSASPGLQNPREVMKKTKIRGILYQMKGKKVVEMAFTSILLRDVGPAEFVEFFKDLLTSLECVIIEDGTVGKRLNLVAVDRKRTPMWALKLMNLFGGFSGKRTGIEIFVEARENDVSVELAVRPYLREFDIEAHANKADVEKCERIMSFLVEKIGERYRKNEQNNTTQRI